MKENETNALEAFGRQAEKFDALDEGNEILKNMRSRIRRQVTSLIKPGSRIFELNAGTGLDAVYFAQKGYEVLATDGSMGMINELNAKISKYGLKERVKTSLLSYNDLADLDPQSRKFDLIFSNFGGLNCALSMDHICSHFPAILKNSGYVCLVIMPPICPWELSYCIRGNLKMGLRRLKGEDAEAHLEGKHFKIRYYKPSQIRKSFPEHFTQVSLKGLGSFMPPPYMENFPEKWPSIFRTLTKLDGFVENLPPFNAWADHFMIVMQYNNKVDN